MEVWLLRTFNVKAGNHVTIGFIMAPKDYLMNKNFESICLQRMFQAISNKLL